MLLHEIAHCRAGDKGTVATLTVVPHDDADYPALLAVLTPQRVREGLDRWVGGEVTRHELPLLCCLQFVCTGIRGGGVTVSTELDTHGKSLSSRLLALDVPLRRG
ncbi:AtuA-related protein [Pseudonocardia spirodelae]|uniref:AtuA-like ferredoxin-fold domain-containing protein n=1 Tax=Pseudonocardia spirodelae TaxID=3133431 RepID=A0ABU8T9X0_9PSEU